MLRDVAVTLDTADPQGKFILLTDAIGTGYRTASGRHDARDARSWRRAWTQAGNAGLQIPAP